MGCIFTMIYSHFKDSQSRNVSGITEIIQTGIIEITNTDLILHANHGKNQMLWSLDCLRKSGWDVGIFLFETGKDCPTGQGIYAFKCSESEELYKAFKEQIMQLHSSDKTEHNHGAKTPFMARFEVQNGYFVEAKSQQEEIPEDGVNDNKKECQDKCQL